MEGNVGAEEGGEGSGVGGTGTEETAPDGVAAGEEDVKFVIAHLGDDGDGETGQVMLRTWCLGTNLIC